MVLSAVFSRPSSSCTEALGRPYKKARIRKNPLPQAKKQHAFQAEFFTETQAFQKNFTEEEATQFIRLHAGTTFKSCVIRTETEELTVMANRRGEIKTLRRPVKKQEEFLQPSAGKKNYILPEGKPVPFLVELGVMTKEGTVIAQKYGKFRQINRFLEYIDDIAGAVESLNRKPFTESEPLTIVDFGSGKSYLTFAVYYFFQELKKIPVHITGIDLKEDVIQNCAQLAKKLGYKNLSFKAGDIGSYSDEKNPDIVITPHACDTATDLALSYAARKNAKAILSVPCCQHEISAQLEKRKFGSTSPFASIAQFGILRERLAALATDAVRAELLSQHGYDVQVMEFISLESTAKNILIRAVKKSGGIQEKTAELSRQRTESLLRELQCSQKLKTLFSQ